MRCECRSASSGRAMRRRPSRRSRDSYGTLSEVALGLQFGKRVFGLAGVARVHGAGHRSDAEAALVSVANHVLAS